MSVLKIENVSYVYGPKTPFEVTALKDVNIQINENRITGIIGHTGSGKSTLVQMFNGLIRPTSGRILLDGEDIWEKPKEIGKVRFRVGLVMQYPEYQLFEETVRKDIAYGPSNMGLDEAQIQERVLRAIEFVGLEKSMLDKSPFDLSGGQKRRAAIAGVMAMEPEILVLDEPAAGLDPAGRSSIFKGIVRYAKERGASVIIVSHSMEDMARYCDDLIVMNNGELFMAGDKNEIFSKGEELKSIGLDVPQITEFVLELEKYGIYLGRDIYTVEAAYNALLKLFGGDIV
ncbi:MAG: energy-coupling factor transporter ATPase [Ruminococcaceae bacterium]|nr:energy-coupling factor transporter ATPase [Oscillospiraceae bacterium]